ncbi:MAG: TIM-barrel domain-containing protein [Terracidiphilus sp.]
MRLRETFDSRTLIALALLAALGTPCVFAASTAIQVERQATGVAVRNGAETLHLTVCSPTEIHIVAGPGDPAAASPQQPWIVSPCQPGQFEFSQDEKEATLSTSVLKVTIGLAEGNLVFKDAAGKTLLSERGFRPRSYVADTINGEKVFHVNDVFIPVAREGFYGLGQHQNGVFNYRGTVVELGQANTDVALPMLISSNGYGILWNTAGLSYFDNRFATEMKLSTVAADAVDYYFFYGPEIDQIVHQYREMTGHAPLFGEWAYGFVQSKDRYKSAQQLLDIAGEYRAQHVPLDFIVQDWFWWKIQGDPEYSDEYLKPYPDIPGALKQLHDEHVHAMISVWAVMDPKSKNFQQLKDEGYTIPGTPDYDATNPKARDAYWDLLVGRLFAQGWDGFWLDSSEPETNNGASDVALFDRQLSIGSGARYTNVFPLLHTQGVYEHWRATTDQKRVFILTRSAFLGQQRNAAVTWSGDVYGTFMTFARQIPAGLNFAVSGIPYWTTDIAGYGWPLERATRDPAYQELYTRWYEFGAFCPIFRTHGHRSNDTNELFSYGAQTPTLIAYDKLRYRLLPYIYSLAWRVTSEDYTMQRPLLMDWRTDEKVRDIGDQFMFGPSILVNPVTTEGATSRFLYLPPAAGWYDFWTGEKLDGGKRILAPAPLDRIPLYIRAGAIIPMGPEIEYAGEKPDAPIELRIYRGADGSFSLYEDEGDSYAYEKGTHAITPIRWDDATGTLTIGARQGTYPGMPAARDFRVILVDRTHGVGARIAQSADKEIHYEGSEMRVKVK